MLIVIYSRISKSFCTVDSVFIVLLFRCPGVRWSGGLHPGAVRGKEQVHHQGGKDQGLFKCMFKYFIQYSSRPRKSSLPIGKDQGSRIVWPCTARIQRHHQIWIHFVNIPSHLTWFMTLHWFMKEHHMTKLRSMLLQAVHIFFLDLLSHDLRHGHPERPVCVRRRHRRHHRQQPARMRSILNGTVSFLASCRSLLLLRLAELRHIYIYIYIHRLPPSIISSVCSYPRTSNSEIWDLNL